MPIKLNAASIFSFLNNVVSIRDCLGCITSQCAPTSVTGRTCRQDVTGGEKLIQLIMEDSVIILHAELRKREVNGQFVSGGLQIRVEPRYANAPGFNFDCE